MKRITFHCRRLPRLAMTFAALGAALCAPLAQAGSQTGLVSQLNVRASDNLIYFWLTGTHVNRPACATYGYWMIKDENADTGKRQYEMLKAALLAGKSVTVTGFSTCIRWGDGEDVNEITLQP